MLLFNGPLISRFRPPITDLFRDGGRGSKGVLVDIPVTPTGVLVEFGFCNKLL